MSTTADEGAPRIAVFAKRRDDGVLWGRTGPQLAVLLVAGYFAIQAINNQSGHRLILAVVTAILVALGFIRFLGRPMADVVPALAADGVLRLFGQHVYRGGPFRVASSDTVEKPRTQPRLPGALKNLSFLGFEVSADSPAVGIVKDKGDGTVTAVLEVVGETFPLLDTSVANTYSDAFRVMLDGLAKPGSPLVCMQLLHRVIPDQGDEVVREARVRGGGGNDFVRANQDAWLRQESERGVRHESFVIVRLKPSKARAEIRELGGGDNAAAALAYRFVSKLGRDLAACGVEVLGWLPERGVAAIVRSAFDPSSDAMVTRRGGGDGDQVGGLGGLPSGVNPIATEPIYAKRALSYYSHNDKVSRVWWITEYPRARSGVVVGFLQPLILGLPYRHTISLIFQPVNHRKAQQYLDNRASSQDAKEIMDQKIGRRRKRSADRERQDLTRHEDQLVEGIANYRIAALVSVTAANKHELGMVSDHVESAMNECNMEAQTWYVETDQAFAMAALPFARGI